MVAYGRWKANRRISDRFSWKSQPSLITLFTMAKGQIQKKAVKKKPLKTKAEKRAERIARKNAK